MEYKIEKILLYHIIQNTPTTMTSIADFQATAKDEINRLVKPLTAYQLYNQKTRYNIPHPATLLFCTSEAALY